MSFRNLVESTFSDFGFGGVFLPLLKVNGKECIRGEKINSFSDFFFFFPSP